MTAETTKALIAAARRSFATVGYAATSMDALCAEAGLTRGALYHHFGGKDGLLVAVVRQMDGEMTARLQAVWKRHEDPFDAFKACCLAYFDLALDAEIQRIVFRDAPAVLGQRLRDIDAEGSIAPIVEALDGLMASGRLRRIDPEALARMLNGAMIDAVLWIASSDNQAEAVKGASDAVVLLLDGLAAKA